MILEIVRYGAPVLREKGKPVSEVTPQVRQLAADMLETMYDANGVGLAAQQVGVPLQLAVLDVRDSDERPSGLFVGGERVALDGWMPMVLLNPRIAPSGEKEAATEGCLSFPEITGEIRRPSEVEVCAMGLDGGEIAFRASGLLARAIQHEVDHLNGVLFIDRMGSATRAGLSGRLKRLQRETVRR